MLSRSYDFSSLCCKEIILPYNVDDLIMSEQVVLIQYVPNVVLFTPSFLYPYIDTILSITTHLLCQYIDTLIPFKLHTLSKCSFYRRGLGPSIIRPQLSEQTPNNRVSALRTTTGLPPPLYSSGTPTSTFGYTTHGGLPGAL